MNKIYRLVWNSAQRAWVVAGEFAAAKGKGKTSPRRLASTAAGMVGAVALSMVSMEDARAYVAGGGINTSDTESVAIGMGATTGNVGKITNTWGTPPRGNSAAVTTTGTDNVSNIALGENASSDTAGIALGNYAIASTGGGISSSAMAIGNYAKSTGTASTAIGLASLSTGQDAIALGTVSGAYSRAAVAVGPGSSATGVGSTALGSAAIANGTASLALGDSAQANVAGGVALGYQSNATRAAGSAGYLPAGISAASLAAINATTASRAAVDIGSRQITSVAAGTADSDGVNVAQLKGVAELADAGWNVADSSGTKANIGPNGKVTFTGDSNVTVAAGGADDAGTLNVALNKNLDLTNAGSVTIGNSLLNNSGLTLTGGPKVLVSGIDAGTKQITNVAAGVADTDAVNVSQLRGVSASHYYSVNDGGVSGANYLNDGATGSKALAAGISASATGADSVALGSYSVANTAEGIAGYMPVGTSAAQLAAISATTSTLGAVSVGDAASGKFRQINGVAAGTVDSDAVNVAQLKGVAELADAGWNVADSSGTKANIGPNGKVTFTGDSNVTVAAGGADDAGTLNVALNKNLDLTSAGSLTIGNSLLNDNGLTLANGPKVLVSGIDAGTKQITNVAAGVADTDAVNVSQLRGVSASHYYSVNDGGVSGANYLNDGATGSKALAAGISASATGADSVALGSYSVANTAEGIAGYMPVGTSAAQLAAISATTSTLGAVSVGDAASGKFRQINGVAAGTVDSDAVNVAQLKGVAELADAGWNVADSSGTKANIGPNGKVTFTGDSNVTVAAGGADDAGTLNVALNKNLDLTNAGSVTIGNSLLNNSGLTLTGGPKVLVSGIDAGSKKITNVLAGEDDSDAVNVSQLKSSTKYFKARSEEADAQAIGVDSIAVGPQAIARADNSVAMGNGAIANYSGDIALGAGSVTGPTTGSGGGYAIDDVFIPFAGANPTSQVSVGSKGNERLITNVAAGSLSFTSTDAVNGSQLYAITKGIEDQGDILNERTVKYDWNDLNGDGQIDLGEVNYSKATLSGTVSNDGGITGGTKITNLAQGEVSNTSTDAINGSQLFKIAGDTTNNYTTINGAGIRYVRTNEAGLDELDAFATGKGSTAVGYNAQSKGVNSLALGNNAVATANNSVALGAGSQANGSTLANAAYLTGTTATGEVNVGGRRITGVSDGAMDDDAVTVAQLKKVSTTAVDVSERALKYDWNDINGNGQLDPGEVDYSKATLSGAVSSDGGITGGTKITNLAQGAVNASSTDAINGSQLFKIAGDTTNNYTTINGAGIRYVRTNEGVLGEADAYAQGQGSTAVGYKATSTGAGSIAVGQNSLASATNAIAIGKDAVASDANSVALGNGSKTSATVATTSMTIDGKTYAVAGKAPVGTVSVGDVGQERTITNVAAGRVTASSTDAVNGSQLYATNTAIENINTTIETIDEGAVKYDRNSDGTVNHNHITLAGGPTTISNLADGVEDSDAVNYSQLKNVENNVTNIANGTDGMFQVNNTSNNPKPKPTGKDSTAGGAGAVASGDNSTAIGANSRAKHNNSVALGNNSVTDRDNSVSMGYAGGERQVTNVAAGTQGTDAVNVNQLKSGISSANQYTDNKFNSLKNMVDDQDDKLSAGIAGAMAMAGLPQAYQPGASMVAMAGSTYQDQSAVALGVSVISDNGKWVTKLSGSTNTQGDLGGAVGVGYQW
ncbi:YadA-like family protein [Buttiauxella selenatireducens]|uniref:YadA-like family protein n=1 Tax=Buttiauxella selenatireducens TaxID=3073902 RepID=A0ABY9S956_9ENTR|nr:YadA-like family protein [Buttiauxella sp. R73]WMY73538.1 YadA-like family protein [Buttiauxella sp. R73]